MVNFPPYKDIQTPYRDPWARVNAWRQHPIFSSRAMLRSAFPGLGYATVAFTVYCAAEYMLDKPSHGHHAASDNKH
ncbi:hypothetical protein RI367_003411 [Sorochytrium milnesiophthora]